MSQSMRSWGSFRIIQYIPKGFMENNRSLDPFVVSPRYHFKFLVAFDSKLSKTLPDQTFLYPLLPPQGVNQSASYGHIKRRRADSAVYAKEMAGPWNRSGPSLERGVHGLPVLPGSQEPQQGHCRWVVLESTWGQSHHPSTFSTYPLPTGLESSGIQGD